MNMYRIETKKDLHAFFTYRDNAPLKIIDTTKWQTTSFFLKPLEIE